MAQLGVALSSFSTECGIPYMAHICMNAVSNAPETMQCQTFEKFCTARSTLILSLFGYFTCTHTHPVVTPPRAWVFGFAKVTAFFNALLAWRLGRPSQWRRTCNTNENSKFQWAVSRRTATSASMSLAHCQ